MQRGDIFVPLYVVARTPSMRPSLQHVSMPQAGTDAVTLCGQEIGDWSRAYQDHAIEEILCMKCARVMGSMSDRGVIVKSSRIDSKGLENVA